MITYSYILIKTNNMIFIYGKCAFSEHSVFRESATQQFRLPEKSRVFFSVPKNPFSFFRNPRTRMRNWKPDNIFRFFFVIPNENQYKLCFNFNLFIYSLDFIQNVIETVTVKHLMVFILEELSYVSFSPLYNCSMRLYCSFPNWFSCKLSID